MARSAAPRRRATAVASSMLAASMRTLGAIALIRPKRAGSSVTCELSVMCTRNLRELSVGTNAFCPELSQRTDSNVWRTVPMSSSARGVGCMPVGDRTKSGSSMAVRSCPSHRLAVGWLRCSCSAARVTLRVV